MAYAIKKWTSNLIENGYDIYSLGEYGITKEQLSYLQSETHEDQVEYTILSGGDTGEMASAEIFRLKHPANHNVNLEDCVEILNSKDFMNFIMCETHVSRFDLDRIQAHIYRPDDYLAKHTDADSDDYLYTFIFILQAAEEGGEFVIYFGDEEYTISPQAGTLIVLDSRLPHEVKPVIKGDRKTLCAFLKVDR